jgi:hypothetical protein
MAGANNNKPKNGNLASMSDYTGSGSGGVVMGLLPVRNDS